MRDPKEITINGKQLSDILDAHKLWFMGKGGERANLSSADLRNANLRNADLSSADLSYADLRNADLSYADLSYADLSSADLSSANLRNANLRNAKNAEMADAITRIIPDGDIIGWKKCRDKNGRAVIVKLSIGKSVNRSNATGRKCRCDAGSKDAGHYEIGSDKKLPKSHIAYSLRDPNFTYWQGKVITPEGFDENRWEECSSGVHFFITRWEAENY